MFFDPIWSVTTLSLAVYWNVCYQKLFITSLSMIVNPLTPVPAVTSRDEPWPFFHFWHHHFWPKSASSVLNFCRWKITFHWFPNQSAWPNGNWDVHKNAQKVEWKTWSTISCHCMWPLHGKIARLDCTFLEVFECEARPFERKEEKGKAQTILKVEKPNGIGHFLVQNFDFCTCLSPNALERDASKKKGLLSCCRSLFV